jgi:hypothetical protein
VDIVIFSYLLNMLSGKELTEMQNLTPIRQVLLYASALSYRQIGVRAESVVNARFCGVTEDLYGDLTTCTLLDFVNSKQASGIPSQVLETMLQQGEIAKVEVLAWERCVFFIYEIYCK